MSKIEKLEDQEVCDRLASLRDWSLSGGKLHRELKFADFSRAFGFMASVAVIAEARDHHPEWSNVYNRVVIDLTTHDAGGISARDFELAQAIDRLLAPEPRGA